MSNPDPKTPPKRYKHLDLPIVTGDYDRKKRKGGFGYTKMERDYSEFYTTEVKKLTNMAEQVKMDRERYKKYFNPKLIFKVKINDKQSLSDEGFRNELERMGLTTISSAPDKKGYWVAFTDDEKFLAFKEKMQKRAAGDKATVIDAITGIEDIPKEEKLGDSIKLHPVGDGEVPYLDIEIWRMSEGLLKTFVIGLQKFIEDRGGRVTDNLVTENFCLMRIIVSRAIYGEILGMREIAHVDRPPRVKIEAALESGLAEVEITGPPSPNASGILVVDSGMKHHPILESAIGGEIAVGLRNGKIVENKTEDEAGHGTKVGGIALYGDVRGCIDRKEFRQEVWIYSAKVMYADSSGYAAFDPEELLEHQLAESVERIVTKHPKCKIVNLSLGNSANKMFSGSRQFSLASQIDELATKHGLIFVVAAGNNDEDVSDTELYPDFLLENTKRVKIIDPASAAHALTVGSIFKQERDGSNIDLPSHFTRVGPGLRGMIKPELIDYGGGQLHELVTINPDWIKEGRLYTLDKGTSFSAPLVAHKLAKLINAYPSYSHNMIKALLISSARVPPERPERLAAIDIRGSDKECIALFNIYGYGKADLDRALYSEDNRVLLLYDGEMGLNRVNFFSISLPQEFINEKGERSISVTLVFDPPVNRNRLDYLGVTMEAHLFKNKEIDEVRSAYSQSKIDEDADEVVPENLRKFEMKLSPGVNLRKRSIHQRATAYFKNKPEIETNKPLVLAVVSQNRWVQEPNYVQPYAVIVTIEHSRQIALYNQVLAKNRARTRVRS